MNCLYSLSLGTTFLILRVTPASCDTYHRQRRGYLILLPNHKLLVVFKYYFIYQKGKEHLVPAGCLSAFHKQPNNKQRDSYRRLKWQVANLCARVSGPTDALVMPGEPRAWGCSQPGAKPQTPRSA